MESAEAWQSLFENWPDVIPRKGAVFTRQGELIPFVNFMISPGLVLLERDGPDVSGARKVIIAYPAIDALKLSSPGAITQFQSMGFREPL